MRPFISYAREDRDTARRLYDDLREAGISPWFDEESLVAGQNWREAIGLAVASCSHFVVIISEKSVNKRGFVQKEMRLAIEALEERPPDEIFVIPVRLDDSRPKHDRLRNLHCIDLFRDYDVGLKQLLKSLRSGRGKSARKNLHKVPPPTPTTSSRTKQHRATTAYGSTAPDAMVFHRDPGERGEFITQAEAEARFMAGSSLDRSVLFRFLSENFVARSLDSAIADLTSSKILCDIIEDWADTLVESLDLLEIYSTGALERELVAHEDLILRWAKEWLRNKSGPVEKGVCLTFLGYIVLSSRGEKSKLERFIVATNSEASEGAQALADKILETYSRLVPQPERPNSR